MVPFYMRHVTCLIVKIVQIRVPSIFFYSILGGQNHETIVGIGHVMWCSWRAISYPTPHKFILPLNWWLRCAIWGKWRTNFEKTEDLDGQRIALQCGSGSPPKFRPSFSTALTLQVSRGNGLKFAEWLRLKKFVCKAKCMYQGRKNAEKKKTRRQIIAKSTIVRRNPNAI